MEFHGEIFLFWLVSKKFVPANKFLLFNVYLAIYFRTQTSFDFVYRTNLKRLKFIGFWPPSFIWGNSFARNLFV